MGGRVKREGVLLVRFARVDLALEVALLIVEVLELEMETVDLLSSFGGKGFGLSSGQTGVSVEATEMRYVRKEMLLLLCKLRLSLGSYATIVGLVGKL